MSVYDCLNKYVRVGSNACDQASRLSGCTGAPSLWYKCGDVRPDPGCELTAAHPKSHARQGSRIKGLVCIPNPPSIIPLDCSNQPRWRLNCKLV